MADMTYVTMQNDVITHQLMYSNFNNQFRK